MQIASWTNTIDWSAPAGVALKKLVAELPRDRHFTLTIFGSAPLQLLIDNSLLSADVDLFCESEDLSVYVHQAGLDKAHAAFHIQVGSPLNFRAVPGWPRRATNVELDNCTICIPHPIDILIGKLSRLELKDLDAFRLVIKKTGHPTEEELIQELQLGVDLFRPNFDEEQGLSLADNCRKLWPIVYGREIDPRAEIIAPALEKRRLGYDLPTRNYNQELRDALRQ